MHIALFPIELVALQAEICSGYHPALTEALAEPDNINLDLEDKIGVVCTYCNIAIDGTFSAEGMLKLYDMIRNRLIELRVSPHGIITVQSLPKEITNGTQH